VKDVISKYGKSTKENDDKQIGFYGLGLKAGHAVSDNFFFITCWEGIKYTYIMYKGGISGVKIDLLHEEKTEEKNGTIFKIVIQYQLYQEFKNAIEKQLAYIPNIYYSGNAIEHNNNKVIYYSKSKNWVY